MTQNIDVLPLFSTPVAMCQLEEDFTRVFDALKAGQFEFTGLKGTKYFGKEIVNPIHASVSKNILDHFPEEKLILLEHLKRIKDTIFRLETTEFKMSTSWATKTCSGGWGTVHSHYNSFFSAVLYDKDAENSSSIDFHAPTPISPSLAANDPVEWNIFNSRVWSLDPSPNLFIVFPSHLLHTVSIQTSKSDRYSLAMNFFPVGNFGSLDSSVCLDLIDP